MSPGPVRERLHRIWRTVAVLLVGVAAAAAALVTLGDVRAPVGPVETELSVVLVPAGGTEVAVPPVGRLVMATHAGPLRLRADVRNVDVAAVSDIVRGGVVPTSDTFAADIRDGVVRLAVRSVLVALLGAAVATALVFRRVRAVVVGTAGAAVAMLACGGVAAATFSSQALDEPQFDGLLAQAPALIGGVSDARTAVDSYGTRLTELTGNVARLYGALEELPEVPGPDTTTVLWVSDVHNNPAAYRVMDAMVEQFGVEAVLDTGDSTDLGSTVENPLIAPIGRLGVPYVWVRGNHDSTRTQLYVESIPGVVVLDGPEVVEVAGLRVAGIGDPRFTPVRQVATASAAQQEQLVAAGEELARGLRGNDVDVALVHEPPMAGPLHGVVPLVLDGHVHRRGEQRVDGTLELTQGSSGGAGLRTFDGGEGALPLEMSILHFDPVDGTLVAVDEITVAGIGSQQVTFQRRTAAAIAPEPVEEETGEPEPGEETVEPSS
jgi:predicted phosphodiesterase